MAFSMRRIVSVLAVVALMAAMVVASALPAFAVAPQSSTCGLSSSLASEGGFFHTPRARALFHDKSVQEIQRSNCGSDSADPQGPPA
jgi:hypothetical protein